MTATAQIC